MGYYAKLWVDYPFEELGDNSDYPLREVEVLSYDGNKYCRIRVDGLETTVKAGYITYTDQKKTFYKGTDYQYDSYPCFCPNRHFMNNKEYAEYRKSLHKRKVTYTVALDGSGHKDAVRKFKNLHQALKYYSELESKYEKTDTIFLNMTIDSPRFYSTQGLMYTENEQRWLIAKGGRKMLELKTRHEKKYLPAYS